MHGEADEGRIALGLITNESERRFLELRLREISRVMQAVILGFVL